MFIEIEVKSTAVRQQTTKRDNVLHWQKVGYDGGDDWPVVFDWFLPEGRPLPVGKHQVKLALKADQWGSLQVDPFNSEVVPAK